MTLRTIVPIVAVLLGSTNGASAQQTIFTSDAVRVSGINCNLVNIGSDVIPKVTIEAAGITGPIGGQPCLGLQPGEVCNITSFFEFTSIRYCVFVVAGAPKGDVRPSAIVLDDSETPIFPIPVK